MAAPPRTNGFEPIVCVVGFHHARFIRSPKFIFHNPNLSTEVLKSRAGSVLMMALTLLSITTGLSFPSWLCPTVLMRKADHSAFQLQAPLRQPLIRSAIQIYRRLLVFYASTPHFLHLRTVRVYISIWYLMYKTIGCKRSYS